MLITDRDASLRRWRTGAYYLGFLGLGLMDALLGPTLPWLAEHASIAVESGGIFFAARSGGYMVGSLIGGRYCDRVPGHRVMAAGLLCTAMTLAPVPSIGAVAVLVAAFVLTGAGAGALDVGGNTLLAWVYGDRVGPFLNGLHACFGVGSWLAPILVGQAYARGVGVPWVYWLIAALLGLFAILLAVLPSPSPRVAHVSADADSPRHTMLLLLLALSLAAYAGLEVGFGGWLFTYAIGGRSMSRESGANLTSAYWGAFLLGRLVSIPTMTYLARRERRRPARRHGGTLCRVLETALVASAAALAVLFSSHGERTLWIGTAMFGLAIGPIFPTLLAIAEQRLKLTGRITSFFLVGAGLGAMVLPWLFGLAMRRFGTGALFPSVGASLGLVAVFYLAMAPSLYMVSLKRS